MEIKNLSYLKSKRFLREEAYFKKQQEDLIRKLVAQLIVAKKGLATKVAA